MPLLCWSSRARRELNAALAHAADEDPERAARLYTRIDEVMAHLHHHPAMGRPGRISGTRELQIPRTPFVAIYTVERSVVRLIALHHTVQGWPTAL